MKGKQTSNQIASFSNYLQQEDNLLQDQNDITWGNISYGIDMKDDPHTVKIQKIQSKLSQSLQSTDSLMRYINNPADCDRNSTVKSFKRMTKQRQHFLKLDSKIQNISLKPSARAEKINQLVTLIEAQKIHHTEKKLKQFMSQLIQIADDVISQKKCLQRELQNIISLNKLMSQKLKSVERQLAQSRSQKVSSSCRCHRAYSFSKNNSQSPNSYLQRFQFAKTVISSIEELELRKVEEEQGLSMPEMPLVQLLWILKNKTEGAMINISHGLLDRIASGPTLKQWIKKIDQRVTAAPKISPFSLKQSRSQDENMMNEFISVLQENQNHLINNIKLSRDPLREIQIIKYSSVVTFTQILMDEKQSTSRQQAMAYFGTMNRCLKLIQKKSGIAELENADQQTFLTTKNMTQLISAIC